MTGSTPLDDASIRRLRDAAPAGLLLPDDDGYDAARLAWNARFDRRPAAILRCTSADHVSAGVALARGEALHLTVRSGGHDYAGNSTSEGGLLLDLSAMDEVRVDPERRAARVGPGATWGDLDRASQAHGLATPGATVSTVGVTGFTLGGGVGWLSREHGLGVDNLSAAELVTAEGEQVRASEDENPGLFWALRGAGANFGVVTALEYALHGVGPEVVSAQAFHPFEAASGVVPFFRDFMSDAPDELQMWCFILRVPPADPFPEAQRGRPAAVLVASWTGDIEEGERALAPVAEFGDPMLAAVQRVAYVDLQQSFDAGMAAGQRWYSRARNLGSLPDSAIGTFLDGAGAMPGPFSTAYIGVDSGAIARVDADATAYPHREGGHGVHILAGWSDPTEDGQNIDWAADLHDALAPHAEEGVYGNLLSGDEEAPAREAWGKNLPRLRELKARWDPDNLFGSNHNIEPAG